MCYALARLKDGFWNFVPNRKEGNIMESMETIDRLYWLFFGTQRRFLGTLLFCTFLAIVAILETESPGVCGRVLDSIMNSF